MKKSLIIPSLLWAAILVSGCGNQNNIETPNTAVDLQKSEVCNDNKWTLTNRAEWWDITVCAFDDDSFCFLEDLESWLCEKGLIFFEDTGEINTHEEIDNSEALNTNGNEESESSECDQMEQNIVCWKDGNTYQNKCYLDEAWVEEETELAEIVDGTCIFG